ncbi:hypothetical protein LIER_35318 [Lithospermum erythrorhizon]|uniref:Uncharacterized protein n=1 Tax=Lithospermum erythrorhizon TaxID=34254 RepID=A0AAV3NP76_LITER
MESQSYFMSRDVVFYETEFPYAFSSPKTPSTSTTLSPGNVVSDSNSDGSELDYDDDVGPSVLTHEGESGSHNILLRLYKLRLLLLRLWGWSSSLLRALMKPWLACMMLHPLEVVQGSRGVLVVFLKEWWKWDEVNALAYRGLSFKIMLLILFKNKSVLTVLLLAL